jgi:hypothetical protein
LRRVLPAIRWSSRTVAPGAEAARLELAARLARLQGRAGIRVPVAL